TRTPLGPRAAILGDAFLIARPINLSHTACSEKGRDRVCPDLLADERGPRRRDLSGLHGGRRAEECSAPVVFQQGFDVPTQRLVARASLRARNALRSAAFSASATW